jgi:hypothetical protein
MANGTESLGLELAKEGVKEALEPVQNLVKRLFGPAADEIGLSFADSARVWRMKRALRLLQRVNAMLEAAGVQPKQVAPRLLFPILDGASLEDDDDLQERWAALLANAATPDFDTEILPSFSDVLKQLTSAEARFLETVDAEVLEDDAAGYASVQTAPGVFLHVGRLKGRLRKETLESVSPVMLGNLQRLGLLTQLPKAEWGDGMTHSFGATNSMYFSPFGKAFVRACRKPVLRASL